MKIIEESSSDMTVTEKVSNSCLKNLFQGFDYCFKMKVFAFMLAFLDQALHLGKFSLFL